MQPHKTLSSQEATDNTSDNALCQTRRARPAQVRRLACARREQEQEEARGERGERQRGLAPADRPLAAGAARAVDDEAGDGGAGDAEDGDDDVVAVGAVEGVVEGDLVLEVENEEAVEKGIGEADDAETEEVRGREYAKERGTYPQIRITSEELMASVRVEKSGRTWDLEMMFTSQ